VWGFGGGGGVVFYEVMGLNLIESLIW